MRTPDGIDIGDVVEVGYTQCRRDHGRRRAGDAVGGEDQVVRGAGAGERLDQVGAHAVPEFFAGDLIALVGVDVVTMPGRTVHAFVGQFVVVLHGVHQRGRIEIGSALCRGRVCQSG